MNKVLMLSVMVWVMAASAETVLWYSFDEGDINEKTVSGGTIVNKASNGDMPAVPHALKNNKTPSEDNSLANWATYAEGFDADYHVYDPVSRTFVQTADRALDFNHSGGSILTVANDVRLRSQPMTVEAFVQFPQNAALTVWNVIAVQPAFMPCANADAWGFRFTNSEKLVARFTPPQDFSENVNASNNVEVSASIAKLTDGNWHHVAFTVDESNTVKVYFDYMLKATKTLAFPVQFTEAENCPLMIGATQQTGGVFTGKMNEFRLSNVALNPESFLRKSNEEMIENLDPATLIWYSFGAMPVCNRGNSALYSGLLNVQTLSATGETYPKIGIEDVWSSVFRQSFAAADEIANRYSLYNSYGESRAIPAYLYANDLPDVFTNSSFTIECVIKADGEIGQFTPFVRRRGGGNVQLNLGVGSRAGYLSGMVLPEGADAQTGAISLNDYTVRVDDGAWHHVALVRDKETGKVHLYHNYSKVATANCTSPLYPTGEPLTFAGTSSGNAFKGWMDEARITMKALTEERFFTNKRMRADGDVRAHVTFDGTMAAEELGTVFVAKVNDGREPAYSDEVPAKYICDERGQEGCRLNAQSLRLDGGVVKFLGSPWLRSDEAQTIEFFVKGEAQDAYAPVVRFGCSDGDTAIPVWALSSSRANPTEFLMTRWDVVNGENRQADSCETSVTLFDGKWHHVALTFAPNAENSDRSDIAVWKDYEMVFSKTTDGRVAYDQAVGMLWLGYNGTKTFTGWIDELRITKGVIDSKKFLRAKNFSGVTIIIK